MTLWGNDYKKPAISISYEIQTLQPLLEIIFVAPINSYCTVCLFHITNLKHHLRIYIYPACHNVQHLFKNAVKFTTTIIQIHVPSYV